MRASPGHRQYRFRATQTVGRRAGVRGRRADSGSSFNLGRKPRNRARTRKYREYYELCLQVSYQLVQGCASLVNSNSAERINSYNIYWIKWDKSTCEEHY